MKVYWIFLVLISSQHFSFLDGLRLVDNGYEDLCILINENIQESDELLDRIQEIFSEASTLLYKATHKRAYFKTLKVVIPRTWSKKNSYKTVSGLSSLTSHIRIGDDENIPPHTSGSGACGQAGSYMFLPLEEFMMQEGQTRWGIHDHVIVHEWGHLRWGLRDEYPTLKNPGGNGGGDAINPGDGGDGLSTGSGDNTQKFYQAGGVWKPVSCSRELNGYASVTCTSGQPVGNCDLSDVSVMISSDCQYCPSQSQPHNASIMDRQYLETVVEFCDKDDPNTPEYIRHNSLSNNEQNTFCKGKSAWEVMREHEDFRDDNNPPMLSNYPPLVDIQFVQQSINKARVFVIDSSGSMGTAARITKVHNMMQIIIEDVLPDGSWISLIDFDSEARLLTGFVQLNSPTFRQYLVSRVPNGAGGGTCIPCGLELAVDTISKFEILDSTEQAEVILLSDGQDSRDMESVIQQCIDAGVVVTSVALSNSADQRLVNISERTGGRLLHIADNGTVSLAAAFTDIVSGGIATDSESATTMMNEQISITVNDPVNIEFNIDDGLGKDTTVTVLTTVNSTMSIQLNGPNNLMITKTRSSIQTLSLVVTGVSQIGKYTAQVTSSTSAKVEVIVTSKPTSTSAQVIRSTVTLSSNEYDFSETSLPLIFVHLRKGESPVKKAKVKVLIEDAQGSKTCELQLLDNGAGDDMQSGDGIYTATILRECIRNNGRHSSKVLITGTAETVATLYFSSRSAMIGTGIPPTTDTPTGSFERVAVGDAYTVSNYDPAIAIQDVTPPGRITDIQVIDIHSGLPSTGSSRNYTITWTAPGDDANVGNASFYEMRISNDVNILRRDFLTAEELNTGGSAMSPKASGKVERLVMTVSTDDSFTSTTNFAIVAVDEVGNRGPVSNIIFITIGSTSQFEVIEEACTDDCYVIVKDCGKSLTVRNGQVNLTNVLTTAGTSIPVKCDVGYELTGGTTILCLENGTWSNSVTCDIVGCGGISIPNGGLEFPEGTKYGDTAFIKCSNGYHLTGVNSTRCMSNGIWETPAACEKNDCGDIETIAHGHINFTNIDTTYGESVQVTCNTGYKLFGGSAIVCLAEGQWSKTVRCNTIDCGPTNTANGDVDYSGGTTFDTQANITCYLGYHFEGTGSITCLESGMWSSETECVINDCGSYPLIPNGIVNSTGALTTYGQTVPVVCNVGYESRDGEKLECLADGNWKTVICDIKDCDGTSILNGKVIFPTGTKYNAVANVECHDGYRINGSTTLTCLSSGMWTSDSECIPKDCGTSVTITNGFVNFTNVQTTFGETVPILCNKGYELSGGNSIKCETSGNWATTASCVIADCGTISILNGNIAFPNGTKYNATADVECNARYRINGSSTLTCLSSGVWTTDSECIPKDCGTTLTIINGFVNFTNVLTTIGQTVPIICQEGFELTGGSSIKCEDSGEWTTTASCEIADCGRKSILNGEVIFPSGTKYNAVSQVACHDGYRINGSDTLTCLSSGIWTPDSECIPKDCGATTAIANGFVNFTNVLTTFGQTLPIVCDKAYKHSGGNTIRCEADGEWKTTASCEIIDCERISILNGKVVFPTGTKYNAVADVECHDGYRINGSDTLTCLSSGMWTTDSECIPKDCGTSVTITNGFVNFTNVQTTFGQTVPVLCNEGYRLSGGSSVKCETSGKWTTTASCEITDCGRKTILNGEVIFPAGTKYDAVAQVACHDGYRINGSDTLTCLSSGIWKPGSECIPKDCGATVTITNGFVNFTKVLTTFGQTLPIVCEKGYKHSGGSTIRCEADGEWKTTASCEIIDCLPTSITDGEVSHPSGTKYSARAIVQCNTGYKVVGTGFLVCLESGLWGTESQCVIRDCGRSETVDNGKVNFTDALTTVGQSVPVICNIGYRRTGGTSIECLADGTWSKPVTCELVGCGGASIANGEIRFPSGTDYNAIAFVNCSTGFHLTMENNQIVCLHSGRWNIPVRCEINDCGTNVIIPNGHADFTGLPTTYGEYVSVICDQGYTRKGGTHIQCLSDGVWSQTVICKVVDCGHTAISNGALDFFEGNKYNAKAKLDCDVGFRVNGTGFIKCRDTGHWSNDSYCYIIDCGSSETVANGHVNFTDATTTHRQSVPVSCNLGYRRTGGTSIECLADGTWSKSVNCELVGCGGASIANGEIRFPSGTDYNAIAFVNCSTGFHYDLTMENNQIVCLHSGVWNISVQCKINDCGSNVIIPNGHVDFTGLPTTYGQYVPVICDQGYTRQGGTHVQCLSDGVWSRTVICEIVDCGHTAIPNGALDFFEGNKYSAKAKLNCDVGFRVHGTGFIQCMETGHWSNDSICLMIDCGRDVSITNGNVDFTDAVSTYGNSVPVICDIGYEIKGSPRVECLSDGLWSTMPICQITECDTDVKFKNGRANSTVRQATFGESIHVVCDDGYLLNGNETITCLSNRTWSTFPVCEKIDAGMSSGLKVVSIVAGSFGLLVLVVIGLLTRSIIINARTRAPGKGHNTTYIQHKHKYMPKDTIVEPMPDYDMDYEDWYLYDNKQIPHFDQHHMDDIYY